MNAIASMVAQMQTIHEKRPRGDALRREIIRLNAHMSQRSVAHELGISRAYVFRVLRDAKGKS